MSDCKISGSKIDPLPAGQPVAAHELANRLDRFFQIIKSAYSKGGGKLVSIWEIDIKDVGDVINALATDPPARSEESKK